MDSNKKLGEIIVLDFEDGLIFVTVWINAELDSNTLQILIGDDQNKVIFCSKKPESENTREMLENFI